MLTRGERVVATKSWPGVNVQLYGGGNASFDLSAGDQGTVYAETSPFSGIWIVFFDKGPTEMVMIADGWLAPLAQWSPPVLPETPKQCICTLANIMSQGCTCGYIKRYVPPHKRILETKKEGTK